MAETQHLVMGLGQLEALGLSSSAVRRRAQASRLHRVHHGVYSLVPPSRLTVEGRYLAAVLACGAGGGLAALSHRSAADLHGLRECHRRAVEVIVPGRSTRRHPGIQVHRASHLTARDTVIVDGIRVTTVARAMLDLAAVLGRRALERALDQAEVLRVFDLTALREQIERNPGHPGAAALRATLERHHAGTTVTWSDFEERFLAACRAAGLPDPQVQPFVDLRDGALPLRPDFVWRAARLAVETDGEQFHLTRRAFQDDRLRDQRLLVAGWRVVRITWRQLHDDPARVTALVARLLAAVA